VPRLQQQQQQQQQQRATAAVMGAAVARVICRQMKGGLWRLIVAPNERRKNKPTSQLLARIINKLIVYNRRR